MSIDDVHPDPYAEGVDPSVSCSDCIALCCRLTVVLIPEDHTVVPMQLTDTRTDGLTVMRRAEDGWCVAVDRATHLCTIYASRPTACRRFATGAPYCRAEREDYARDQRLGIPLKLRS